MFDYVQFFDAKTLYMFTVNTAILLNCFIRFQIKNNRCI